MLPASRPRPSPAAGPRTASYVGRVAARCITVLLFCALMGCGGGSGGNDNNINIALILLALQASGGNDGATTPSTVTIPAGTFTQGDQYAAGSSDELPLRQVTISRDFHMARNLVTNAQYAALLNWALDPNGDGSGAFAELDDPDNPGHVLLVATDPRDGITAWQQERLFTLDDSDGQILWNGSAFVVKDEVGHPDGDTASRATHPVIMVTWYGSQFFCWVLNEQAGAAANPIDLTDWGVDISVAGWRLPTEAEWEYAARGGWDGGAKYPWWTADPATHTEPDGSQANYNNNNDAYEDFGDPSTTPVGIYPANAFGLFDMAGNVYEWCTDWYDSEAYDEGDATDPEGPATGTTRVLRNGSWADSAISIRNANRFADTPSSGDWEYGFRPVRGLGAPVPAGDG